MKQWSALTHRIYRTLRRENVIGKPDRPLRLGLAVSGGADSVAMMFTLIDLASALKYELVILHVHHGGEDPFRDQAASFTRRLARRSGLPFRTTRCKVVLKSEKELRDFRRSQLLRWQQELGLDLLVTAHHSDDLLETRLMRLIRGTGRNGLRAIPFRRGVWLRPLLEVTHYDLVTELQARSVSWLEDPSNRNPQFFRNWLREVWLPQLAEKNRGALRRMSLSLENLTSQTKTAMDVFLADNSLSRSAYLKLNVFEQKQSLAELFYRLKMTNYSQNQIEEVRKRLDNSSRQHMFTVSGLEWRVNAEQISVRRRLGDHVNGDLVQPMRTLDTD